VSDLLDLLTATGALDPSWRDAFAVTPREEYLPDTVWQIDRSNDSRLTPLHRDVEPDRWLALARADTAVETQVDDGHPADDGTGWEVTSSSSQPTVVAQMLTALDVQPGMRVLEIGTGTGWNAALLAHRVGAENVVTVEIDPAVAAHARAALDRGGLGKVTTIVGDGTDGWLEAAPYDRVIATAGARDIPYTWIAQTAPGGRVVVPLLGTYKSPGVLTLTVDDAGIATGRVGERAAFMGLRSQRTARVRSGPSRSPDVTGTTDLHPYLWVGNRDAATAIGLRLGDGVHAYYVAETDDAGTAWLRGPDTGSWAWVELAPEVVPYECAQGGPRRLLDEVTAAYQWWLDAGSPPVTAWQWTVDPHGQRVELEPA